MSERHLMRAPRKAKATNCREAWWYEERDGICVCVEYESAGMILVAEVKITTGQIVGYFNRLEKI